MGLPRYDGDCYFLADFLYLAHRARCAAAILALLFADIFRRLRVGLPPLYTPANALIAASIPDSCFATRSLSFRNCFTNEDKFAIESPSVGDCSRLGLTLLKSVYRADVGRWWETRCYNSNPPRQVFNSYCVTMHRSGTLG